MKSQMLLFLGNCNKQLTFIYYFFKKDYQFLRKFHSLTTHSERISELFLFKGSSSQGCMPSAPVQKFEIHLIRTSRSKYHSKIFEWEAEMSYALSVMGSN